MSIVLTKESIYPTLKVTIRGPYITRRQYERELGNGFAYYIKENSTWVQIGYNVRTKPILYAETEAQYNNWKNAEIKAVKCTVEKIRGSDQ